MATSAHPAITASFPSYSVKGVKSVKSMNGNIAPPINNEKERTGRHQATNSRSVGVGGCFREKPLTPLTEGLPLTRRPVDWSTVYGVRGSAEQPALDTAADPRFDDATAEARFQRLRASGRYDMLLEIATFAALEARCGELHGRLLDDPHDWRTMRLYEGYSAAWELCRDLVSEP